LGNVAHFLGQEKGERCYLCITKTINWNRVTISYDDIIFLAQVKIRREITLRERHVGNGSGVHIQRWVRMRKVESANGIFNVGWVRCVDIENRLLRSRSKNSTFLRVGIVVASTPIVGWVCKGPIAATDVVAACVHHHHSCWSRFFNLAMCSSRQFCGGFFCLGYRGYCLLVWRGCDQ